MARRETEAAINRRVRDPLRNFAASLGHENLQILPDSDLRGQIAIAQNPNALAQDRATAVSKIENSVLRLIPMAVTEWQPGYVPPAELVGEAYEVIRACIRNFKPNVLSLETGQPIPFAAYVSTSLRKKFKKPRTHADLRLPFQLPGTQLPNFQDIEDRLTRQNETQPSWRDITEEAFKEQPQKPTKELSKKTVERVYFTINAGRINIDEEIATGKIDPDSLEMETIVLDEVLADSQDQSDPSVIFDRAELSTNLAEAMMCLTVREREIISMHIGLGTDPKSPLEIAEELGVSRQAVHDVKKRAIRKIQRYITEGQLDPII